MNGAGKNASPKPSAAGPTSTPRGKAEPDKSQREDGWEEFSDGPVDESDEGPSTAPGDIGE